MNWTPKNVNNLGEYEEEYQRSDLFIETGKSNFWLNPQFDSLKSSKGINDSEIKVQKRNSICNWKLSKLFLT